MHYFHHRTLRQQYTRQNKKAECLQKTHTSEFLKVKASKNGLTKITLKKTYKE